MEAPRSKEKGKKKKKEQTNEGDKEPWLSKGCCLVASGFA